MTDEEWWALVVGTARMNGWMAAALRPLAPKEAGGAPCEDAAAPRLLLFRDRRVIVAELTVDPGRLGPEQRAWLAALAATGIQAGVWSPAAWVNIVGILADR